MSTEIGETSNDAWGLTPEVLLETLKESVDEVFTTMLGVVGELVDQHGTGQPDEPGEIKWPDGQQPSHVDFEAIVDFKGVVNGAVILRAERDGALDIARGLLRLGEDEVLEIEDVMDALGECANMLTGSLKCKALDPCGGFHLGTPKIDTRVDREHDHHFGGLVYQLSRGCTSLEIWMDTDPAEGGV